jgi:hypothetical protein
LHLRRERVDAGISYAREEVSRDQAARERRVRFGRRGDELCDVETAELSPRPRAIVEERPPNVMDGKADSFAIGACIDATTLG